MHVSMARGKMQSLKDQNEIPLSCSQIFIWSLTKLCSTCVNEFYFSIPRLNYGINSYRAQNEEG